MNKEPNYAKEFHEATGGCWHELDKSKTVYNLCSCGKICGNLDEHIQESNPTYQNAADILKRMRDYCGEERYNEFIHSSTSYTDFRGLTTYMWITDFINFYILNAPALLQRAVEFLKGE